MTPQERATDHLAAANQGADVGSAPIPPTDHMRSVDQRRHVGGGLSQSDQDSSDTQPRPVRQLVEAATYPLMLAASTLDELERARISTNNRARACREAGEDPSKWATEMLVHIDAAEAIAVKQLELTMAGHPLGPWVAATPGLGLKQVGRLLAATGDPYWNHTADRARRGPAELWAYCGYHVLHPTDHRSVDSQTWSVGGVAPRRKKGQRAAWSHEAHMRAYLCAEKSVQLVDKLVTPKAREDGTPRTPYRRQASPYRAVYEHAKAKHEDAVHNHPCERCTPKGKPPAPIGSPLKDSHKHARAVREVAKAILRDLWKETRRLYAEEDVDPAPAICVASTRAVSSGLGLPTSPEAA